MEERDANHVFMELARECERLTKENKILNQKLSVALQGLKALESDGNFLRIPQKTLEEIKSNDKELPQNANTEEKQNKIED